MSEKSTQQPCAWCGKKFDTDPEQFGCSGEIERTDEKGNFQIEQCPGHKDNWPQEKQAAMQKLLRAGREDVPLRKYSIDSHGVLFSDSRKANCHYGLLHANCGTDCPHFDLFRNPDGQLMANLTCGGTIRQIELEEQLK